jgi:hypothetical protein
MNKDRAAVYVISIVFGIPIFYFLSAGPFIRIYSQKSPPAAVKQFYAPLNWAYRNTPLQGFMDWYARMWRPKPPEGSN